MAINASVFQETQVGMEDDYGVAVPADLLFTSMGFDLRPQGEADVFAAPGSKFDDLVIPNKEWSSGTLTGRPTYTELQHILATIFEGSVVTSGGVSTWTFISHARGPDATRSMTVEAGSDDAGSPVRATGVQARSLSLVFDRDAGPSMGGEVYGKALEKDITLTPDPTGFLLIPVVSGNVSVYLDRTDATDLGVTKLLDQFHVEFAVNNKFGPKYVLDRDNGLSPDGLVELKPTINSRFSHEANAAGMALLDDWREGGMGWLRIEAISSRNIPGSSPLTPYSLVIDMAVGVERPEGFRDVNGVRAVEFTLRGLLDGVWGNAFIITLKNGQAAL